MKATILRYIFEKGSDYRDLAPVFPELLKLLLEEIDQMPSEEDEEILEMFIEMNVSDLKMNRKPEGYNRKGRIRLVFPMGSKEFYLKTYSKNVDLRALGSKVEALLKDADFNYSISNEDPDLI
jgi:hypothetical protein